MLSSDGLGAGAEPTEGGAEDDLLVGRRLRRTGFAFFGRIAVYAGPGIRTPTATASIPSPTLK